MTHESEFYRDISFVTLTYDHCKRDPVLDKADMQKFMKRLRKNVLKYVTDKPIRFFGAGEYGELSFRPHYHFILYGVGTDADSREMVNRSWKFGYNKLLPVLNGGCAYVAKYCVKIDSRKIPAGWQKPFALYSQGLGRDWMLKYARFLADPNYQYFGQVLHGDYHVTMPKYYRNKLFDEELKLLFRKKYGKYNSDDLFNESKRVLDVNLPEYVERREALYLEEYLEIQKSKWQAKSYVAKQKSFGGKL